MLDRRWTTEGGLKDALDGVPKLLTEVLFHRQYGRRE